MLRMDMENRADACPPSPLSPSPGSSARAAAVLACTRTQRRVRAELEIRGRVMDGVGFEAWVKVLARVVIRDELGACGPACVECRVDGWSPLEGNAHCRGRDMGSPAARSQDATSGARARHWR